MEKEVIEETQKGQMNCPVSLFTLVYGALKSGVKVNIIGVPGIGKTFSIYKMAKEMGKNLVHVNASQCDFDTFTGVQHLSELKGVQYTRSGEILLDKDGNPVLDRLVKAAPSSTMYELLEDKNTILFIDEINRAPQAIQNQCLSLIQDGVMGPFRISDSVLRVAAMNFSDIGLTNMSLATVNRFCHIEHVPDLESYLGGVITGFMETDIPIVNSPEEVERKKVMYLTLHVNFLRENPTCFVQEKDVAELNTIDEFSYPTPRSWGMAVDILSHLDKNSNDYVFKLVAGCIGKHTAKLFMRFLANNKETVVDLTQFLGKEDKFFFPNPDRPDEVYQIIQNLEYWFNKDPNKWFPMWKRIVMLAHNFEHKYGAYTNYDNVLVKYWTDNYLKVLKDVFKGKEAEKRAASKALRAELDGVYEVMTVSAV